MIEKVCYEITPEQLYNVPLPFLILAALQEEFIKVPVEGRSHMSGVVYNGISSPYRTKVFDHFPGEKVYDILKTLFKPAIFGGDEQNESKKWYNEDLRSIHDAFKLTYEVEECFKNLQKYGISKDTVSFIVPSMESSRPEGMTDAQYSNYVLGYKIYDKYFKNYI